MLNIYLGSELVDWMLKNMEGLKGMRDEAVRLAQHMVEAKIVRQHENKNANFQDLKTVTYRWKKARSLGS